MRPLVARNSSWASSPVIVCGSLAPKWPSLSATWTTAATFNRYNSVAGWKLKSVPLPAGANGQATLYIAFLFTSAYGNNCHLDLVHVTAVGPPPPATVTIGTGTSGCSYPYTTYWMDGRTQMLFSAAEIAAAGGSAGAISTIGFNVYSYATQTMNNFAVRFMNTTATSITGWVNSGMTTCFTGSYAVPGTGWQMITMQTPFIYDGTNLTALQTLANQFTTDWYRYQVGKLDRRFEGIVPWEPEEKSE